MNVWLVTTGSSDLQLTDDESWCDWKSAIQKSIYRLPFEPVRAIEEDGEPYRLPARVLAHAHDRLPDQVQPYLSFPLLQNFTQELKVKEIQIDRIIVLLSDQKNIFPESERQEKRCPYWQDTCQFYPILENYLGKQFPNAIVEPLLLQPKFSEPGLDNWDAVLELVQQEIKSLKFETEPQTVYVSHQAGTPAISSAVQFCSLAKFGDRVRFLVSNEYSPELTGFVESSSYLRGIEIQQAKKLLENHDYSGIKEVLKKQIEEANKPKDKPKLEDEVLKHISYLLDVAIQWNFAKFEDFAQALSSYSEQNLVKQKQAYLQDIELAQTYLENAERAKAYLQNPGQYWWWTAYEAAYLGVARLNQGDTVEAMFHSFRAIEGLLSLWFEKYEKALRDAGQPELMRNRRNQIELPREITALNKRGDSQIYSTANSYGQGLYFIIASIKNINQEIAKDIWVFGNFVVHCRNDLFHKIEGLKDQDSVFKQWKSPDEEEFIFKQWQTRVLNCLNFIAQDDLPQPFSSLKESSLMAQVHKELEKAIVSL